MYACVRLSVGAGGIKNARAIVLCLPTLRASLSGTRFPAPSSRRQDVVNQRLEFDICLVSVVSKLSM